MKLTSKLVRGGGLLAVAAMIGGGSALTLATAPAGASNRQVSVAGSFTTYQLMHALFPTSINDLLPGGTTSLQRVVATPTYCAGPTGTTTYGVKFTTTTKYPGGAPNGSTAGKKFLFNTEEQTTSATRKGCVTIGRSSSPPTPKTITGAHFDYYAYALDGVSIMVGTNAGGTVTAPTAITLQQAKNIYACWKLTLPGTTATKHAVTTWKQAGLGTSTQTINRFWPQTGSGTRAVYKTILGFTPAAAKTVSHCATPAVTHFTNVTVKGTVQNGVPNEENTESGLVYATKALHETIRNDLYIYSSGKFVSEWNNTTTYGTAGNNRINQSAIGNFTSKNVELASIRERYANGHTHKTGTPEAFLMLSASTTAGRTGFVASVNTKAVVERYEWYRNIPLNTDSGSQSLSQIPGVRYVFNVCDTALPSYDTCKAMVGFDNQVVTPTSTLTVATQGQGTKSRLCAGDLAATITANGFVPLYKSGGPANSNYAGSTCREFPGGYYPGLAPATHNWVYNTWVNPTK